MTSPNATNLTKYDLAYALPGAFASLATEGQWRYARHLEYIEDRLVRIHEEPLRLLISLPPQHGKLVADSTLVPTIEGWKKHGDLKVGDYVFGSDGKPVRVVAESEPGVADRLVTLSCGAEIKCHENHEWFIYKRSGYPNPGYSTVETKWLESKTLVSGSKKPRSIYQIDYCQPNDGILNTVLDQKKWEGKTLSKRRRRGILKVEKSSAESGKCIQVDSSDGIYLITENFVPTHNSTLCSGALPAWYLGHYPSQSVMLLTYQETYSQEWGKRARAMFREYGPKVFGFGINPDAKRVGSWETEKGGKMYSIGIGGAITGKSASGLLIVDDYVKGREEAMNPAALEEKWDAFWSDVYSRLSPWTSVVIIGCLVGDSRVLMGDGSWKPIKDIVPGEYVWSYDYGDTYTQKMQNWLGTNETKDIKRFTKNRMVKQRVSGVWPQGYADTVRVRTNSFSIEATKDHPFLLKGNKWVKAGDLKKGDIVKIVGYIPTKCKKYIRIYHRNMTSEEIWLLGFLFGDGWVTKQEARPNRSETYSICCAIGVDEDLNIRVKSALERFTGGRVYETNYGYYRVDCNKAGRALEELGLLPGVGAKEKSLPDWLWKMRPHGKRKFLEGILEADGGQLKANKTLSYRLNLHNRELVEQCRLLAIECGIAVGRLLHQRKLIKAPHSHEAREYDSYSSSFRLSDCSGSPIKTYEVLSVEESIQQPVYDLSVEGTENFIAEGFIVHNTRWSDEDIIGRLKRQMESPNATEYVEKFEEIRIPALADDENDPLGREMGEPIVTDPNWHYYRTKEQWLKIKENTPTHWWDSLYQQRPAPRTGNLININWFRYYDSIPEEPDKIVISWDTAQKSSELNDFTVAGVHYEKDGKYYLVDVQRDRMEHPRLIRLFNELNETWRPHVNVIEDKGSGTSLIQHAEENTRTNIVAMNPDTAKDIRADAESMTIQSGRYLLPNPEKIPCPWLEDFLNEVRLFPRGRFDDQVDMMSQTLKFFREHNIRPEFDVW